MLDMAIPDELFASIKGAIEVPIPLDGESTKKQPDAGYIAAQFTHTAIVFLRYMFLAYRFRLEMDNRTFGNFFYALCDELNAKSIIEAMRGVIILLTPPHIRLKNFRCRG